MQLSLLVCLPAVSWWAVTTVLRNRSDGVARSMDLPLLTFAVFGLAVLVGLLSEALLRSRATIEALRQQEQRDPLTGLLNRAGLKSAAGRELERARRSGGFISALAIEIDGFADLTVRYGRPTTDRVLFECAKRLGSVLRPFDILGRLPGDEFVLFLPSCDAAAAGDIAERCRAVMRPPMEVEDQVLEVAISVGVTSTAGRRSVTTVIAEADMALFAARRDGRPLAVYDGQGSQA